MHSLVLLSRLAHAKVTSEPRPDDVSQKLAMSCSELLGKALQETPVITGGAGIGFRPDIMHGLLAALGAMLTTHHRSAALDQRLAGGAEFHFSFISMALRRLADEVRAHWQQPREEEEGGGRAGGSSMPVHKMLHPSADRTLTGALHRAALNALIVSAADGASAGDLENIHGAAADILLQLLSEYRPAFVVDLFSGFLLLTPSEYPHPSLY